MDRIYPCTIKKTIEPLIVVVFCRVSEKFRTTECAFGKIVTCVAQILQAAHFGMLVRLRVAPRVRALGILVVVDR